MLVCNSNTPVAVLTSAELAAVKDVNQHKSGRGAMKNRDCAPEVPCGLWGNAVLELEHNLAGGLATNGDLEKEEDERDVCAKACSGER